MKNANLDLFKKGNFEDIDTNFIFDGRAALGTLKSFQEKYKKPDIDTLLNELHDSIVGNYLGFSLINTEKHGLDCKYSKEKDIYLESKVASIESQSITATFNDTTLEKADSFRDEKVWLALSVWNNALDLAFICYGQNEAIGDFLEEGVKKHKRGETVRSTQSISLHKLIFDYKFKILAIGMSKNEIYQMLTSIRGYKKLDRDIITELKDFTEPYFKK